MFLLISPRSNVTIGFPRSPLGTTEERLTALAAFIYSPALDLNERY